MQRRRLFERSLAYYWRSHLTVIFGAGVAVSVLTGALLVGDSVRASLRDLFLSRLGSTDYLLGASHFFRQDLAWELQSHPGFVERFTGTSPLILFEGAVAHAETARRASRVAVYGIDENFWSFHGLSSVHLDTREALVSPGLARDLGIQPGESLLLQLEKPSPIPRESLHGRKDEIGRTLRLDVSQILPASSLGEFSLQPRQGTVRALFVSLGALQRELEQEGRVNALLISESGSDSAQRDQTSRLRALLGETFQLEDLGLRLRRLEDRTAFSLESESTLLEDLLAEKASAVATSSGLRTVPVLTYLANSIAAGGREIPYSVVTALDAETLARFPFLAKPMESSSGGRSPPPIYLNVWAARDLQARIGDRVRLEYYVWHERGELTTESAEFETAGITALEGAAADPDLTPEYPGITEARYLGDWDPPFPMDLGRIRPQDEEYWDLHRTTPKAFVELETGQGLWSSRHGKLTSLRLLVPDSGPPEETDIEDIFLRYESRLRRELDPFALGFFLQPVRAQGLEASHGATDFGEYFVYFSFFLVVSALLLTALFFRLGIEQRLRELGILRAVGFAASRVRSLFLAEGSLLAGVGTLLGIAGAVGYGHLVMLGLRTWWTDAVGTTLLTLYVVPGTLVLGAAAGMLTALATIALTLRGLEKASPRSLLAGSPSTGLQDAGGTGRAGPRPASLLRMALLLALLGLVLLGISLLEWIGPAGGFFGAGTFFLLALHCAFGAWLQGPSGQVIQGRGWKGVSRLGFRSVTHRPGRSLLCVALIATATFILVAVDSFRRDDRAASLDPHSGSGGYPLLAESLLPLAYDLNTRQGREAYLLDELEAGEWGPVHFVRFRLRPGDDASCLNLYRPQNPRILAPGPDFYKGRRFSFQASLAETPEERENPWLLLERGFEDGAIPVIADANSMTYVLHRSLGDELILEQGLDQPLRLRLVAALADSIFQSELIMSERHFLQAFPGQQGHRFFLVGADPARAGELARYLEGQLADAGLDVESTLERLAAFHRVENTYLSTFQTLGGLGLLLGTVGLATVLIRNVLERRRELALLQAVGYRNRHLQLMVVAENSALLLAGLSSGALCAFLAISPALAARGDTPLPLSLALVLGAVLAAGLTASIVATRVALRSPLLPALRSE